MAKRAGKPPSRLELRKAVEAAEKQGKTAKAEKKPAAPKKKKATKKKAVKTAVSERLRLLWGVFDNSNQQVAVFPYAQRADAEKKLKDMEGKPRGPFFIQPVKEPILEPEEAEST